MRLEGLAGSFWPTERQKLLLRAAVCEREESVAAWRRLRASLDLDKLEPASTALLALVGRRLDDAGIDDPLLPRLRGIYRRTWYLNHLRLDRLTPAVLAIEAHGLEPLVVGGWELALHYYSDLGLRNVAGLRVIVRPAHFDSAKRALSAAGWTRPELSDGRAVQRTNSARFIGPGGDECMVHRRLFDEFPEAGALAEERWKSAFEFAVEGTTWRALGRTDQLLSICLAGARTSPWPSLLWLADAMIVLGRGTDVDWASLINLATRLHASPPLRDALAFMRSELDAPVPGAVVEELEHAPVHRRERLAYRAAGARWPLIAAAPQSLTRFLRVTADRNALAALIRLPSFLRDEWSLEHSSQVPLEVLRKGLARIRTIEAFRAQQQAVGQGHQNGSEHVLE